MNWRHVYDEEGRDRLLKEHEEDEASKCPHGCYQNEHCQDCAEGNQ